MFLSCVILVAACCYHASGLAVTPFPIPTPEITTLVRRDAPIPTITVRARERQKQTEIHDQPSGTSLQIFPTGIFDDVPNDGITVALGPDLQKQMQEAVSKSCTSKDFTQECQNALMSVFPQTDLTAHTKRFAIVAGVFTAAFLAGFVSLAIQAIIAKVTVKEVPQDIRLNNEDVAQLKSMAGASTFAAVMSGTKATPVTMTLQPPATSTWPDSITIQTLSSDWNDHKGGDVVYHIPKDAAARINDFLAMTGMQKTQEICKGQNLRRADTAQECLQHIQRHAMDLADVGPSNLLQIAQAHIPARPAVGQAIGLPVENLVIDGIPMLIPVYRVVYEHAPRRPTFDMGWDPLVLVRAATSIAIAAHVAMFAGQSILDIWIPKDKVMTDLREDRLACPKNMLCVADECQGQKEESNYFASNVPYCKKVENFGCRCNAVNYGYSYEVEHDYMDKQYEWLEELIKKADAMSNLKPTCDAGFNDLADAPKKLENEIATQCIGRENLKEGWHSTSSLKPTVNTPNIVGFDFSLEWKYTGGDCNFDCESLFGLFFTEQCISGTGAQKYGVIKTNCGEATYNAYNHACAYISC